METLFDHYNIDFYNTILKKTKKNGFVLLTKSFVVKKGKLVK